MKDDIIIEKVEVLKIPTRTSAKSKYREALDRFINSEIHTGRIVSDQVSEAEAIQKGLKRFLKMDEDILVERRGNVVWLTKLNLKKLIK